MRIGIVTQPLEMNYGGILQNWALQQVLKRLGHDPITIDAYQRYSGLHVVYRNIANFYDWVVRRHCNNRFYLHLPYYGAVRQQFTGEFIERHIDKTQPIWEYESGIIQQYKLDSLIVGSDQVWRFEYNRDHIEDMFLKFAKDVNLKRVAYAASFGVDDWRYSPELTSSCAALAQIMDAISVREESGVNLCRDYLGVEAVTVLDPTLLLTSEDYIALINEDWDFNEPFLAVYNLDITPDKKVFIEKLAKDRSLKVRYFSAGWTTKLTIENWLAMFKNASMVITDSFHGTAFCILFGKEFYSLCNPLRGNERISGLLKQLGLVERFISNTNPNDSIDEEIIWDDAYARLNSIRKSSIDFLVNNLN